MNFELLKYKLDEIARTLNFEERIKNDPVQFPRRFKNPQDIEIAGLISAVFAYGNVSIIIRTLDKVFAVLGDCPADFIDNVDLKKEPLFNSFYHRFNNEDDLRSLLWSIKIVRQKWGSLNNLFLEGYELKGNKYKNEKFASGLEHFSRTFTEIFKGSPFSNCRKFEYFFPFPSKGSSCKRLCLFLRWMSRKDRVDTGAWSGICKSDLVVPVDTHVSRIGRYLGFTSRKNVSWKTAQDITSALLQMDPHDPLRFDFLLCHLGISGQCPSKFYPEKCSICLLRDLCM